METGITAINAAMSTIPDFVEVAWDAMTSNPYLVTFLAVSFVYVGIRIFRAIKRAASR